MPQISLHNTTNFFYHLRLKAKLLRESTIECERVPEAFSLGTHMKMEVDNNRLCKGFAPIFTV